MAVVTLQADRGVSLQGQLAMGRGGNQNGSFNKRVALGNTVGNTNGELFIDVDGVSRLRFPANTSFTAVGELYTINHATGTPVQAAQAVFNYTFVTNGVGVTTITANTAAVGFTVGKTNVVTSTGTEDVINVVLTAPGANVRAYLDMTIANQSQVSTIANTRQVATAARVQGGMY